MCMTMEQRNVLCTSMFISLICANMQSANMQIGKYYLFTLSIGKPVTLATIVILMALKLLLITKLFDS